MSTLSFEPAAPRRTVMRPAFWLGGLLLFTLAWDLSGLDMAVMRSIGNEQGFPWRHAWLLERALHDGLRQVLVLAFVALCAWAGWPRAALPRRERLAVAALVALSLLAVNLVKNTSLTSCPWDLRAFGGVARWVSHWDWGQADGGAGRCFPGGHASSGFAFLALCLPWLAPPPGVARRRAAGLRWLAAALGVGLLAGAVQTLRGAHFPSHTLWTLWICAAVSVAGWWLFTRAWAYQPRPMRSGRYTSMPATMVPSTPPRQKNQAAPAKAP